MTRVWLLEVFLAFSGFVNSETDDGAIDTTEVFLASSGFVNSETDADAEYTTERPKSVNFDPSTLSVGASPTK